jgi:hypothetical protein
MTFKNAKSPGLALNLRNNKFNFKFYIRLPAL